MTITSTRNSIPVQPISLPLDSQDLIYRLRTVAGQSIIQPPALDIEAANHIEKLALALAQLRATQQPADAAAIDLKNVSSLDMHLELALRAGPRFQCMGCKTYHQAPDRNRCPSCGREGYLCGAFPTDAESPEWKNWERRVKSGYAAIRADQQLKYGAAA